MDDRELRLECLKLAVEYGPLGEDAINMGHDVIDQAEKMYQFATGQPKAPTSPAKTRIPAKTGDWKTN